MKKTLFICEGNVGRSQMAEGFFNHYAEKKSSVSAGTADVGLKFNFVPREDIIQVMSEKGVDISNHRIKQICEEMLQDIDTIIVLCEEDLLPDFIKSSGINILFKYVPDPYKSDIDGVREIRDSIEIKILELLDMSDEKLSFEVQLEALRREIDEIDQQLISQLAKRLEVVKKVGHLKQQHNIPPLDQKRWHNVLEKISNLAQQSGIPKELAKEIYQLIHEAALDIESK
jgi:protein-tyrosine-phosphatase/chorismate mutase